MSAKQHHLRKPPRADEQTPTRCYFVGRREFEAADVYEVTAAGVERLRSQRRYGESSLDWHGTQAAKMELSHLLITRVSETRPSRDLQKRFSIYVLARLPDGGFVLDANDLARWVRVAGDARTAAPSPWAVRSWLGRLCGARGGSAVHGADN